MSILVLLILFSIVIAYQVYSTNLIEGMKTPNEIQVALQNPLKVPETLKFNEEEGKEETKCQPCPPCGRCPEPAFECKKVPTYSPMHISKVPEALGEYSTYGV